MELYPVFLSVVGRACLVVGSGSEANRRAKSLENCGAVVTLASHEQKSTERHQNPAPNCLQWPIPPIDLNNYWLVIAASDDQGLNVDVATACELQHVFCHVVKDPKLSSFMLPAIVDRSPLLIAITSGGTAPSLARAVKTKLESLIPAAYSHLAKLVGQYQSVIHDRIPHQADRALFWHHLLNGPIGELAFADKGASLDRAIAESIKRSGPDSTPKVQQGFVSLVGAGPGDPDLLTFRALRLIQSADVIVYDRLVSQSILDLRRHDSQLIYAGKARSEHTMAQESINQTLVGFAQQGRIVVRLKGGDPFIFGRGGEEIETLADNQIPFQVVPGITAASGCAAFSGIPLTHRDHAQSCVFVTGHLQNGEINLNWEYLQDTTQTIVVYMGLTGLRGICQKLIEIGRSADTPAALIEQGTTPEQRVHAGVLASLPDIVEKSNVSAPTLLIIGNVVTLREALNWFDPQIRK